MNISYPNNFVKSKRSVPENDLEFLYNFINNNKWNNTVNILEFGCGPSSIVIYSAFKNSNCYPKYYSMEKVPFCIENLKLAKDININFITTDWNDIPKTGYDFIFVDSSTGAPKGLTPLKSKLFRADACKYAINLLNDNGFIALHDWNYKGLWREARNYMDSRTDFSLVANINSHHGVGIYRKKYNHK